MNRQDDKLDHVLSRWQIQSPDTSALRQDILSTIATLPQEPVTQSVWSALRDILNIRPAFLMAPGGGLAAVAVAGFVFGMTLQAGGYTGGEDWMFDPVYAEVAMATPEIITEGYLP